LQRHISAHQDVYDTAEVLAIQAGPNGAVYHLYYPAVWGDVKAALSTIELPAVEVGPHGYLVPKTSPSAVNLPAIVVRPDGFLNAERTPVTAGLPHAAPGTVATPVDSPVANTIAHPSFDWRDAGVGIAIGFLAALALGAMVLIGRRRGSLRRA
jgi:hypothetical protein